MDAHFRSFERDVLPVLNREGIAPLGMKAFGHPYILHSNTVTPMEALHYCLHLPIAVQIPGIDSQQLLDRALEAIAHLQAAHAGRGRQPSGAHQVGRLGRQVRALQNEHALRRHGQPRMAR